MINPLWHVRWLSLVNLLHHIVASSFIMLYKYSLLWDKQSISHFAVCKHSCMHLSNR